MTDYYQKAKEFHKVFDPVERKGPGPLTGQEAFYRTTFKAEELIEFLYAAREGDSKQVEKDIELLTESMYQALEKTNQKKQGKVDRLVDEVDGLIDLLYFTYGSFVLMGINPDPLFNYVHEANMGKIFLDGKPHYHEITGKVLKPEHWDKKYAPEPKIKAELLRQIQDSKGKE
ncbi:HAD family hydrolase [Vagococcus sp.]|uniref:HAD family hydrolase n=1 Tax=Vagococcus sp. TaxID=1933889 RepID=UPI003F997F00